VVVCRADADIVPRVIPGLPTIRGIIDDSSRE
jgi:hypothetical protein